MSTYDMQMEQTMETKLFNATVSFTPNAAPNTAVIALSGDINAEAEARLSTAYIEAERHDSPMVLLDFHNVNYINSTGIALIVGLLARARKTKRRLMVSGLSGHYKEIFTITRLADFMSIYDDTDTALADAAGNMIKVNG